MDATTFLATILEPAYGIVSPIIGVAPSALARQSLLAIAGQETGWDTRYQVGGPAHSFWQFELNGVNGLLVHPVSQPRIRALCDALRIPPDSATIFAAIAWNDALAVGMARLALWVDPRPLPADLAAGWETYLRIWRPGRPRQETWGPRWAEAQAALANAHG